MGVGMWLMGENRMTENLEGEKTEVRMIEEISSLVS
jgi:hypothetical protein